MTTRPRETPWRKEEVGKAAPQDEGKLVVDLKGVGVKYRIGM
jgi:hypothetical protein